MCYMKLRRVIGLVVLVAVAGLSPASVPTTQAGEDNRSPELPSPSCDRLQPPAGSKVAFRAYALGVQIYRWNGVSWDFVAPLAMLYADANFHGKIGIHYAGPTWESNSGAKVVAKRLEGCAPNLNAIPWLLLQKDSAEGPGIFESVTHIQRVNTTGGLAPAAPGSRIGEEVKIPYTAEYYFYRDQD